MYHIAKQSHFVKCPVFELLCNILCDPLQKVHGDPGLSWWKTRVRFLDNEVTTRRQI